MSRWGGEISYNNYTITINDKLGSDNGLRVLFGVNLSSIRETVNTSNMVTRIIPVGYNGRMLPNNETIDSPLTIIGLFIQNLYNMMILGMKMI